MHVEAACSHSYRMGHEDVGNSQTDFAIHIPVRKGCDVSASWRAFGSMKVRNPFQVNPGQCGSFAK